MKNGSKNIALADITASLQRFPLIALLGWQDVRQKYRRSTLGPFWITVSMGVLIATIGIVFGKIFKAPMDEYLPFLATGMILWSYISSVTTEGCNGFIDAESIIKQLPIPLFVHIMRMIWRNTLIFFHNIVILPLVFIAVGKSISVVALMSLLGFVVVVINLTWVALLLAILSARYRDFPQMVGSILQVVFYVTPIMWMPTLITKKSDLFLLNLNPVFHLLEIMRAPLLGQAPTALNWISSVGFAIAGWAVAIAVYGRYKRRIAYWL